MLKIVNNYNNTLTSFILLVIFPFTLEDKVVLTGNEKGGFKLLKCK